MIPKVIHYCWFGCGKQPELAKRCITSWEKYCPDYKIVEWNEDNFDINMNGYTRMCYSQKKYAFLSDYVRLWAVEKYGGIYLDTDVEVIKALDPLLEYNAFYCFETDKYVATGLGFGSEAHSVTITAMLSAYKDFLQGDRGTKGCPELNTKALLPLGLKQDGSIQKVSNAIILTKDYMNPFNPATGVLHKTVHTYSIHWYAAAWLSPWKRLRVKLMRPIHRLWGVDVFKRLRK